jgi:hypothetical protein
VPAVSQITAALDRHLVRPWGQLRRATSGRLAAPAWLLLATGCVMSILTWPLSGIEPQPGLDASWATGLSMAVNQGLQFGRGIVFTYGPLGFLREPLIAYPWTGRLAFAYTAAVQLALCLTLLWALRRNFGSFLAAAAIALLSASASFQEPVPIIVFGVAVALVVGGIPTRLVGWTVIGSGVFVAVQLLAKFDTGIDALLIIAVALAVQTVERRRRAVQFVVALLAGLLGGWVLTGQSLTNIPAYVRGSLEVASGYSQALGYEDPGRAWELWAAAALAGVGMTLALTGGGPRRTRVAVGAIWALLAFTSFKEGFVRHDVGHANIFFATMLGGIAVLPLAEIRRTTSAFALALASVCLLASLQSGLTSVVVPRARATAFFDQAGVFASGTTLNRDIVAARARLVAAYGLDPITFAPLAGHTVDVEPYDANVAWAAQLRWKPVPVFQAYAAYTTSLDRLNADALSSAGGPQRVLRENAPPIDARNAAWESPAATLAMLCHFRAVSTTARWQVLERTANRCGAPRQIGVVRSAFGATVPVPPAPTSASVVYAELEGVQVRGLASIVSGLYRAPARTITLDGTRPYRLVPGTAADGLVLNVPRAADFPAPFSLDQQARSVQVTLATGGSAPIVVRFFAMPIA